MSVRSNGRAHDRGGRGVGRCSLHALRSVLLVAALVTTACVGCEPRLARAEDEEDAADVSLRIAIAPFEGEGEGDAISQLLTVRFARFGVDRLLAPGSFVSERRFDPRADAVRTWAYQAAVDTIVVGRVEQTPPGGRAQQIEAVARSGHSGAELFRHAVHVPERAGLGSALDQLAAAFIRDLGGNPLAASFPEAVEATPAVSANAVGTDQPSGSGHAGGTDAAPGPVAPAGSSAVGSVKRRDADDPPGESGAQASKDGKKKGVLESRLGVGGFQSDAPIEIKADAAEIMAQGEERKLVFQGGVWVHQDNVTLTSDRLEAEYAEGESEPNRLVARGKVHVVQGNRSAQCDRAEYIRATQKITCRGHAELVQGCDIVRGELIELDLAAEKARVEGAASIVINPKQNADTRCALPEPRP